MLQKILLYFTMIATYINLNFVWEFGGLLFMAKKKADAAKTVAKKQNVKEDAMNETEVIVETSEVEEQETKTEEPNGDKTMEEQVEEVIDAVKETTEKVAKKAAKATKSAASKVKKEAKKVAKETVKKVKEKKELVPEVFIQYEAIEAKTEDIIENIKKAYVADGHYVAGIKDLKVYIKPEDGCAYYVINGSYAGNVLL